MREQDCTYCYTIYEINMYFGNTKVVLHYYTRAPKYNLLLEVGRNFALKFKFKINTYAFLMQFCRAQKLNFSKIKALLSSLDDGWLG